MGYPNQLAYVISEVEERRKAVAEVAMLSRELPEGWKAKVYEGSVVITSEDRARVLKIDAYKQYTMDVRQPDGSYKSNRFACKTPSEAWKMASQVIKTYRPEHALH